MSNLEHVSRRIQLDTAEQELSFDEWLELGRHDWPTNIARALAAELLLVIDDNHVVKAVGRIVGVSKEASGQIQTYSLNVTPEAGSSWLGKIVPRDGSIVPIKYLPHTAE